ncbi:InlB B-repeat-containing protein [Erysipelothrix anatis]|uniref:InlB B-repeat-containing protein n=1 Tax=Erysipelothrix anatis TaxID=2683713 RepID=UPI00140DF540|nr:InlB B-repeat-containing protein [Erysipelothrix anatis]
MKKVNRLIRGVLVLALLFAGMILNPMKVEAQSGILQPQTPIGEMHIDSSTTSSSAFGWRGTQYTWGLTYINGQWVYCLTPTLNAGWGSSYTGSRQLFDNLPWSVQNRIWDIAYYGMGFEGDTSPWRYLAAEELIWESIPLSQYLSYGGSDTFNISWTGRFGENIDEINRYKSVIESLIRNKTKRPSFNNQTVEGKLNETITLNDSNASLDRYEVKVGKGVQVVSKTNTQLKLKITSTDYSGAITFNKKYKPASAVSYVWQLSGSQPLFSPGTDMFDPLSGRFTIKLSSGHFELTKLDENGSAVKDVTFRIRGKDYKTDGNGKIKLTNIDLGEITYQEISVPSPIIIDKTVKKATITSGNTTSVTVTNQIGKGIIEVVKQAEDEKLVTGVNFDVRNAKGDIVSSITTGPNGVAKTGELSLGTYTVVETSIPKEYILNTTPQTVTLNYKDSVTRVVTSSATFINDYQPIATIGVSQIRIDTKRADAGLTVETWFYKDLLYDYSLNDFRNAEVKADVYSKSIDGIVASKTYSIESMPEYDTFEIDAALLEVKSSDNYEVRLSIQETNKVTLSSQDKIDTDGYTATEEIITQESKDGHDLTHESIIRTQRIYGQSIETWVERIDIDVPKMEKIRAGRGYAYDTHASYSNELDQDYELELTLIADNQIVDGTFYDRNETETKFNLTKHEDGFYKVPRVYSLKDITGEVISEDHYQMLSSEQRSNYRDGGYQVLTPLWNTDIGSYPLHLETNAIGVNEVKVILSDHLELFAYMYGHFDADGVSKTIELDETIVSPISIYDGNNNGIPDIWDDGSMPDNFGVTLQDGSRVLTLKEKEFFSVLGSVTLAYDLNGGQGSFPGKEVTEGEKVKLPDKVPSRNGYIFDGWLSSSDGKIYKQGSIVQVVEDTKLIAQWKQQVFTVAFNLNGGSGTITSQSVAYGAKVAQPTNPFRAGYSFTGWTPDITQVITEDITFTAQWKIHQYTVKYDANGGTGGPSNITVNHGTSHTIGKAPTRSGYTFAGWKNLSSGMMFTPGQTNYIVNTSVTFVAQWTQNAYTVDFNLNGGTGSIASQSVVQGAKTIVPPNPTRSSYTFTGWTPDIDQAITKNTTFTAQWRVYSHTVAFNLNGGSGTFPSRTKTAFVQLLIPSNAPTRAGYTFSGWKDSKTSQIWGAGANYTPDYDGGTVTLTAQWTAIGETWTNKSLRQSIGNYTVVTYYTPVYQGTLLKRIDYEVVAYKSSGTGYWDNNGRSTWTFTAAGQTRSGTFSYDFRGRSEIRISGGAINVNSTSFTNSASFRAYLDTLGTFSGSGNLNK